jgi:hypothetical protein
VEPVPGLSAQRRDCKVDNGILGFTLITSFSPADATYLKLLKNWSVPKVLESARLRALGELVEPVVPGSVGRVMVLPPVPAPNVAPLPSPSLPPPHAVRSSTVNIEGSSLESIEPLKAVKLSDRWDFESYAAWLRR